jgi:hypothetical protein
VTDKVIDNPILNRPYDAPSRHTSGPTGAAAPLERQSGGEAHD